MPYSRSAARMTACMRMSALSSPFAYAKVRPKKLPTPVRDAIFQNCVFQLSAILEDYLSELLTEWLRNLQTRGGTNDKLPLEARSVAIARTQMEDYRRFVGSGNEVELAQRLAENTKNFTIFDDSAPIPPIDFRSALIKDKKFPSTNNLPVLFRRFGMANIMQAVSKRTRSDFRLALQAFMDVRNALAHESPPSVTDVDVARYFLQVNRWIAAIDREFYSHSAKVAGTRFWV